MSESSKIDISATSQEQACAIISSAIHHLLFAKGQIHQPIAVLRKQRYQRDGNDLFQNDDQKQRKSSSFKTQRKERKLNEMIVNVDRLHDQIVYAIEALTASREHLNGDDDVVLLLRLGQSPLTMARQQFIIQLNGLLSLPRTAIEADKQNPPKPSIARQVFGGKKNSSIDSIQSSLSRIPVLERKLVRFFLSANMDESDLGKALSAPIAPTRSQIFIQAPQSGFAAKGWIPRPFLKVVKDYKTDDGIKTQPKNKQQRSEEGSSGSNETIGTTAEDVDMLALGLSPLKRRALMSPKSEGLNFTKKVKPLIFRQDSDLDYDKPAQAGPQTDSQIEQTSSSLNAIKPNLNAFTDLTVAEEPALTAQELIDQKRMTRMQSRQTHKKITNSKLDIAKHSQSKPIRKQRMICATIIINFTSPDSGKQDNHPTHKAKDDNDHIWFASDIVMQACIL